MTQVTSHALQKVGKGTSKKMSLETTAMRARRGDGADVTWRGSYSSAQVDGP